MMLSLCHCQLRHIHYALLNISTSVLGGWGCHGIWRISWILTRYWRSLWFWRSFLWIAGWLLTNRGQLRWINKWIIKWRRHRYHQWWQLIDLWVTVLAIKAPVITSVATTNTLWTWHNETDMSMWWCYVHAILFVDDQLKARAIFFARQLQSCLSFSIRNKIYYELIVSI